MDDAMQIVVCRNHWPLQILATGTTAEQAAEHCAKLKEKWCAENNIIMNIGRINYHWHWMPVVQP
jgi:hypothetical protein